jgi:hypothetical protein
MKAAMTFPCLLPFVFAGAVLGADEESRIRLLVPAYFYPAGEGAREWDRLLESPARSRIVAIVNPASGPGRAVDPNYAAIFEKAKRSEVTLVGYITTSYGRRPLGEVEADVDRWIQLYPGIRGIFFDEQSSGEDQVDYQAALYQYVRGRKKLDLVLTNPGTACSERYLSRPTTDAACLFEGPLAAGEIPLPAYASRSAAKGRVAALPYGVDTADRMRKCLESAVEKGVGYLYITDSAGPMPWSRLPRYWDEEAAAAIRANRGRDR